MKRYTFEVCGAEFSVDQLTAAIVKLEHDVFERSGIDQMPSVRQVADIRREIGGDVTPVEALTAASKLGQRARDKLLSMME